MPYKVIWSPLAEHTYTKILEYLFEQWTIREAEKFAERVEEVIGYLQKNPKMYSHSKSRNSYRAVLTQQTTLVYRLKEESTIELITFWDNRQDPEKLKY
jgi:plasmid stabilization system protein ParE